MKKMYLFQLLFCVTFSLLALSSYVNKQNQLTELKIAIPEIAKQIKAIQEKNTRLHYDIERFESPAHLMELARSEQFSHLKYPFLQEILTVKEGIALQLQPVQPLETAPAQASSKVSLATRYE